MSEPTARLAARLAVDIGGTFTDVVLETPAGRATSKVLTTASPEEGVIAGIEDALATADLQAPSISLLIHGTTLATNAIIERKGAVTALITTEGFRDVLDIGYESRYDQYDVFLEKPKPLVPRRRRLVVPERTDIQGHVIQPLDEDAVAALVPELRELDVESIAVGFLHSYANPTHEQRVRDILAEAAPDLSVTLSSEACPEIREYERFTTATANAYVRPLMSDYLGRLRDRLDGMGFQCPVLLMTSGGGLTTLETARAFPIRLVESGPAGGAILAQHLAAEAGLDKVISFDMGGTTAKICLIENGQAEKAREFEVDRQARFRKGSGLPLRIPVIEMVEIGAGGGSIARVDALQRITVGPDSAGAEPGPAAYDRGGDRPTITDADIALGKIDPGRFAGGKVALKPELSVAALARDVAEPLGLEPAMAAYGVNEMIDETMANAARVHAVELGKVAAEHTLIAFGGAAPLHVGRVAEKLGIDRILVPQDAGVGSAVGFLRAPVAYEVVRSRNMRLGEFDAAAANDVVAAMRVEALEVVEAGAAGAELVEQRSAFMRYVGQGHEIVVPLPERLLTDDDGATLQEAFDTEYTRLFRRALPNAEVEVLTWALTVSTRAHAATSMPEPDHQPASAAIGTRGLFDAESGTTIEVPIYVREDLAPGMTLVGPALIVEVQTSTLVPATFNAHIGAGGNIVMGRKA